MSVTFDHYEVLTRDDGSLFELGRGAMGITYKAFDTNLRIPVALKVINATYLTSEVARQRFVREARSAAKLRHRHVASVFHLGMEGDAYFYAMEFIDGETVDALIKRQGPLAPMLALQIAAQVARALNAAQPHGLVHRDIKPANLMLLREDDDLVVKVIDFGLAKSSVVGEGDEDSTALSMGGFVGTPHFASPEQLEEKPIDVRSDIYSLGVTLWYMLAGQTPFAGSMAQVMSQHLSKPPPFEKLNDLPSPVATLLGRMLAKDPGKRPQTPADLRREIEECMEQLSTAEPEPAKDAEDEANFATVLDDSSLRVGDTQFESGTVVAGRYRITESLGEGNAGRLFRAEQLDPPREVRLLVLDSELTSDSGTYTQIEREVEKAAAVRHANLLEIYDLETVPGRSFIVSEWTRGFSFLELLRARRELTAEEVLAVLPQAAEGVDYALSAGLKRLDLALHQMFVHFPNVAFAPEELRRRPATTWPDFVVKLNPLGITRELSLSETWGGAQTMVGGIAAPKAGGVDVRSRMVQALGAIVYELLGGTLSPVAIGMGAAPRYTPLATLTEEGNAVLRQALDPAPSFTSAQEFYRALSALEALEVKRRDGKTPGTEPAARSVNRSDLREVETPVPQIAGRSRRKRYPVAFLGGITTIGVIGTVIYFISQQPDPKQATPTPEKEFSPDDSGTSSTADEPEESPPATPRPPVRQDLLNPAKAEAEAFETQKNWPRCLEAWVQIAKDHPESDIGKVRLQMIIQGLRDRPDAMNAKELPALRDALTDAAHLDVLAAMMFLAETLRPLEPTASFNWFSNAAEKGNVEALTQVGLMLSNGEGVERDLNRAVSCFQQAAEQGDPAAKTALAECYLYGKNVPRDEARAIVLLKEAVEKGYLLAMDQLGTCYHRGQGVAQNYGEALRLYTLAADRDYLDALGNLAVLHITGHGVTVNEKKAIELIIKGRDRGNAYCMFLYAQCLESGTGVPRNQLKAQEWYKKAADAGSKPAIDWLRRNGLNPVR